MARFRLDVLPALALIALAACSDGPEPTQALRSEVRDSAGVRIVENQAPMPDSRLTWEISTQPTLSIGTLDGEEAHQLFQVRTATRLADGRVLVANGGTSEIRVFGPSGAHVGTWGRAGEGPGEFTGLSSIGVWPGDSLMAWDAGLRRISIFDLEGNLGRTFAFSQHEEFTFPQYQSLRPDGSILVSGSAAFRVGEVDSGLKRPDIGYALFGPEGELLGNLGNHPGEEAYVRAGERSLMVMGHPFKRSSPSAIWRGIILISPNDTYEIRGYDTNGVLELIVRREHQLREVVQTDLDVYVAGRLADVEGDELRTAARAAQFEGLPTVESFPAFASLKVDALGYLWVEEYQMPGVERTVWTVFDGDGRVQGLVETPVGLDVYEIGEEYILGRATDDFDIEYVQMFQLTRFDN